MKWFVFLMLVFISSSAPAQERYSIIINEIMADPVPAVSLPGSEWIELKNNSQQPINLQGWRLGDANSLSGVMPGFLLQPDSLVIICNTSSVALMSPYGAAIAVTSFPSLDNDGDQLFLRAANGITIHAVSYAKSWYQNELKAEGGWTLEMIDSDSPCTGAKNWKASQHLSGGTPGRTNSVNDLNPDVSSPMIMNAWVTDSSAVTIVFDEPVDSLTASIISNYICDGGISFNMAQPLPPLFNKIRLSVAGHLLRDRVYQITVKNTRDCSGNIAPDQICKVGIPEDPANMECIINEILFNPRDNAFDFVEFYNNSNKIIDAARLYIANRTNNSVSNIKQLSPEPRLIFPGDHIAVTENPGNLSMHYLVSFPRNILGLNALPSFPDDEGEVVVLNAAGNIVDEVSYKEDWHFKLLDNTEGVSLERTNPSGLSNEPGNWHSASSTSGFGTPGYQNSQSREMASISSAIGVTPSIISPDNDGHHDIASINYKMTEPGWVANINIYDIHARLVRVLVKNSMMGLEGCWTWDGLHENHTKLPRGIYIIVTELFNLEGKRKLHKNKIAVGY